jgi:hypothetical protein
LKLIANLTSHNYDANRFSDNADLKDFYKGFGLDGIELLFSTEQSDLYEPDDVIGVHLKYYTEWMSIWKGDREALLKEYHNEETISRVFSGLDKSAITQAYSRSLSKVAAYHPEYLVYHVDNVVLSQALGEAAPYSDEEIIDNCAELINNIFLDPKNLPYVGNTTLLLENLWWNGFKFTDPILTKRLLEKVKHPDVGVMLDIGHLLHTNREIKDLDEGIDYISSVLDRYENLDFIRGIHLHQSLFSEELAEKINAVNLGFTDYFEDLNKLMYLIYDLDSHKPFTHDKVQELVNRIDPAYVVLEFLSSSREENAQQIKTQMSYLV